MINNGIHPRNATYVNALPRAFRMEMEDLLGGFLSDVMVHRTPASARANAALGSLAFTVGSEIYLAADAPPLETQFGRQLLAHELAHVMQKRLGSERKRGS